MNLDELQALVALGESETLEFKRSTGQKREAAKTLCAMLNGLLPGFVVFGVEDNGQVTGQDISTRTREALANELRLLDPFPELDICEVAVKGQQSAIVVGVQGSRDLYTFDGRPYHRIGPTTTVMPRELYERRLLERLHTLRRWETEPVPDSVWIDSLDGDELLRLVDASVRSGRMAPPIDRSPEALLRGFGLIANDRLLNAAVVLFIQDQEQQSRYPQLSLRVGRFAGADRLASIIDNRPFWGNAFHLLRTAEDFMMAYNPIAGIVEQNSLIRTDTPRYQTRVLREALANAIAHRDYGAVGGNLVVAVFDNRIEISNPGHLPVGLSPADLELPHESYPRNPTLAGALFRAGVIEQFGTGTLSMIEWSRQADSPAPTWSDSAGSVTVTLFPYTGTSPLRTELESQLESRLESQLEFLDRILAVLLNGPLSKKQISLSLGQKQVSGPLHEATRELAAQGLIELTIPDKPQSRLQQYRLTESGRERIQRQLTGRRTPPPTTQERSS